MGRAQLSHEHEDLSLIPQEPMENAGCSCAHLTILEVGMWGQEDSLVLTGHSLAKLASFGFGERTRLKKIR